MAEPIDTTRIIEQLKAGAPAILAEYPVRLAYVYGSVARGTATPQSDVDIGVLFEESVTDYDQLILSLRLERRLQNAVDLPLQVEAGAMNTMPVLVLGEVVRDGILIYAREQADRLAYEKAIREAYAVERPRLEAYYRAYMRNLLEELSG